MRRLIIASVSLLVSHAALSQEAPTSPPAWSADFEGTPAREMPADWFVPIAACKAEATAEDAGEGKSSVLLTRTADGFANFMRSLDAAPFRGKRIRLSAQVRYAGRDGRAQMWVRADRAGQRSGFFDNMDDRPITDPQWKTYEIIGDIENDTQSLALGFMFWGPGPVGVDDVRITILPDSPKADAAPRPLADRGLTNLTAFARLVGYVRHFCPTKAARDLDWNSFTIAGVERVEGSDSPQALATTLQELISPVSPAIIISTIAPAAEYPPPQGATRWLSYRHRGYAQQTPRNQQNAIYSTRIEREPLDLPDSKRRGTKPGTFVLADLGDGILARIPIGAYADDESTLPAAVGTPIEPARPRGWRATGNDRSTRLATVILAWNVFEHFYPYHDVVKSDWPAALREGLTTAATDPDSDTFQETLERLGSALHDGHVHVGGTANRPYGSPLLLTWVGEELVVERNTDPATAPGVLPGDVITEIDGVPTADLYARLATRISGATEQWRRYRAAGEILDSREPGACLLTLRHADGTSATVRMTRASRGAIKPSRPANGAELAPGVLYFNLDGAENAELLKWLPQLAAAKGVVFDLRGYPGGAGAQLLPHLTDANIQSAKWNIPVFLMPHREGVTYEVSNWDMPPQRPRIAGKVVFITDGRAISYAESCMGIVEAYKLGEIVGGPTAGTNGNVIAFDLPGRFSFSFTGMKVVKHDGTPHHGRGIFPTVPASPTIAGLAAGKDDVLDRAVEAALAEK